MLFAHSLPGGGGLVILAIPWTVGFSVLGLSRQEYWSGLPFPSPGDLPNPGIEPRSPALQAHSLPTELSGMEREIIRNSLGSTG